MAEKRKEFLPLAVPYIDDNEINEVLSTLKSGWLSTGPKTTQFENDLKEYLGANHVVGVNSCTGGLHVSLLALDIGAGDEVITSPFTFPSTLNVIHQVGATPICADIDPDTFCISPAEIKKKLSDKTKAIIPVFYGGHPCDMDAIDEIAEANSLKIIVDAAPAIGSEYKGKKAGSNPNHITCFSFYANKTMTTGEGGAVATGSEELAHRIKVLSQHGMTREAWKRYTDKGSWRFNVAEAGYKYNMMDIQAALGIHQLKKLDGFTEARETFCKRYENAFKDNDLIKLHKISPDVTSSRYVFPIRLVLEKLKFDRDDFITELKDLNIGTSVHYIPAFEHSFYVNQYGMKPEDYPVTKQVFDEIVSLPLSPSLKEEDIDFVSSAVIELLEANRK